MRYFLFICAGFFSIIGCQPNAHQEGERIYQRRCANCHGESGDGLGALIPPLRQADYLTHHRDEAPCIIRYGLTDTITVNQVVYAGQAMPANPELSDVEITNVINYIHQAWGNQLPPVRLEDVRKTLDRCDRKGQ